MRLCRVPPLLALLFLALVFSPCGRAAEDPSLVWLQAYQSYTAAEKLEAAGRFEEALQRYRYCQSVLRQIQEQHPKFSPVAIDFRLRRSRASIERVQTALQSGAALASFPGGSAASAASAPTPSPTTAAPNPLDPRMATGFRLAVPGQPAPLLGAPPAGGRRPGGEENLDELARHGAINAYREEIRSLRERVSQARKTIDDLQQQLLQQTAREQSARVETDRTRVQNVELRSQLEQAQRLVQDLERTNSRLQKERVADSERIAGLESDLEAARADLEVADEQNDELFAKLEAAASFIEASEKIREQLLSERQVLASRAGDANRNITKLERERDETSKQIAELKVRAEKRGVSETEARRLNEKLAATEKTLATEVALRAERDKAEQDLHAQIKSLESTLGDLRGELAEGGQRIADLEKQLADTSAATASATGALAEENALLKTLVNRQLAEQARRQQARKLLEEEMEKQQVRSSELVRRLEGLAQAEVELTPRERTLFNRPIAAAPLAASGSTFVVEKPEPAQDLPQEFVARAAEANQLAQGQRLQEARDIYAEIAAEAPQSHMAALNLGVTERQLGNYPAAIAAFQRALALKANDANTLTYLGSAEYRSGALDAAIKTLTKATIADERSYLAHYFLAMALSESGNRDEALREVNKALELKPDYVPAVELLGELDEDPAPPTGPTSASRQ